MLSFVRSEKENRKKESLSVIELNSLNKRDSTRENISEINE